MVPTTTEAHELAERPGMSAPTPHSAESRTEKDPLSDLHKVAQKTFCDAEVKDFEKAMDNLKATMADISNDITKPNLTKDQLLAHLGVMVGSYSNVFEALSNLRGCIAKALSDDKDKVAEMPDRPDVPMVPKPEAAKSSV
ncbi:hypothetical protein CPB97_006224 [Podila verticillata]|nr:hypothetical protein CPB97_006224 [Podila verticillata]